MAKQTTSGDEASHPQAAGAMFGFATLEAAPSPASSQWPPAAAEVVVSFDRFRLLPSQRRLLCDGAPVALGSRAFDVLVALVLQRHRVVSLGELMQFVWPGRVVEGNNLQVHVSVLRRLLGAGSVRTVARRGYRFTLPVDGDCAGDKHAAASPGAFRQPAAPEAATGTEVHQFEGLEIHVAVGLVIVNGQVAILPPRVLALLLALVHRRHRPVDKIELMQLVWPGQTMTENNLQALVAALRKRLGPSMIVSIPGEGYKFNALALDPTANGPAHSSSHPSNSAPPTAAVAGGWRREGKLPGERAALGLLARAIEVTLAQELGGNESPLHRHPTQLQQMASQVSRLANARIAAATGHPELAANATELADALVQLGAGLLTLGKREQAQGCLQAAAALWTVAAARRPFPT